MGELLENERTRPLGKLIVRKMDEFFGGGADSDAGSGSVNDEMAEAVAASRPLRGVVSFGILSPEELAAEIEMYK